MAFKQVFGSGPFSYHEWHCPGEEKIVIIMQTQLILQPAYVPFVLQCQIWVY